MKLSPAHERRSDRRHALTGHACVVRISTAGPEVFGGIVDVGARGVRLRVRPGFSLSPGDICRVQLVVTIPTTAPEGPPVRLHGRAVLLRRLEGSDHSEEVAFRFEEPLRVGEAFSAQPPPSTPKEPSGAAFARA
jgi:hypothetical protein